MLGPDWLFQDFWFWLVDSRFLILIGWFKLDIDWLIQDSWYWLVDPRSWLVDWLAGWKQLATLVFTPYLQCTVKPFDDWSMFHFIYWWINYEEILFSIKLSSLIHHTILLINLFNWCILLYDFEYSYIYQILFCTMIMLIV